MKRVEKISSGTNYSAVQIGKMNNINEYVLQISPDFIVPGKVFIGGDINATGAELSFQSFLPGSETGFLHTHKTHEEIYIFIKGSGEFQVDGQVFKIEEGSVVRVGQKGKRTVRNTSDQPLLMICIQYKADSFTEADAQDGEILDEKVMW